MQGSPARFLTVLPTHTQLTISGLQGITSPRDMPCQSLPPNFFNKTCAYDVSKGEVVMTVTNLVSISQSFLFNFSFTNPTGRVEVVSSGSPPDLVLSGRCVCACVSENVGISRGRVEEVYCIDPMGWCGCLCVCEREYLWISGVQFYGPGSAFVC